MQVRDGMSTEVLTVGPDHTLREAAQLMARRHVGSAVVIDPEEPAPGIVTERDVLQAVGNGHDVDSVRVREYLKGKIVFASPTWSLEEAAGAMSRGGFRHLIVVEGSEIVGMLSVRDIVRCWTNDGATSDMPAGAAR
jgi:CBS domain-containing protein